MSAPESTHPVEPSTPGRPGTGPVVLSVGAGLLAGVMVGASLVLPEPLWGSDFAASDAAVAATVVVLLAATQGFCSGLARLLASGAPTPATRAAREYCVLLTLFIPAIGLGGAATAVVRVADSPAPAILCGMLTVGVVALGALWVPARAAQLTATGRAVETGRDS